MGSVKNHQIEESGACEAIELFLDQLGDEEVFLVGPDTPDERGVTGEQLRWAIEWYVKQYDHAQTNK